MAVPKNQLLNPSQVTILRALSQAGEEGLTLPEIKEAVGRGVAVDCGNLGPVFTETLANYPDSLYGLGMVTCRKEEDCRTADVVTRFLITPTGRAAAGKYATRFIVKEGEKVPPALLDPAVLAIRPTKTYGLELYTDEDMAEIRNLLPTQYHHVPAESLRQQACSRRKTGAYADPNDKRRKQVQSILRLIGPKGTLVRGLLTDSQIQELREKVDNGLGDDDE